MLLSHRLKACDEGKSMVEIKESYNYLEEKNRSFIDFSFQIGGLDGIIVLRYDSSFNL